MVSDHSSPTFYRDWLTLLEDMMKKDCVDLSSSEQVAQLLQRQKVFNIWYMIDLHFMYLSGICVSHMRRTIAISTVSTRAE